MIKKYLPYIFLLVLLVEIFLPIAHVSAQTNPINYTRPKEIWGTCIIVYTIPGGVKQTDKRLEVLQGECGNAVRTHTSLGHTINSSSFIPAVYGYCITIDAKGVLRTYPQTIQYVCKNELKGIFKAGVMPTGNLIYCLAKNNRIYTLNKTVCGVIGGKQYKPPVQPSPVTPTTQQTDTVQQNTGNCLLIDKEGNTWEGPVKDQAACLGYTGTIFGGMGVIKTQFNPPSAEKPLLTSWIRTNAQTPIKQDEPVNIPPADQVSDQNSLKDLSYHLLEPIPCTEDTPNCKDGKLSTFDPTGDAKLGEYLNIIIQLIIGLCAVAAVVMIVIGGVEYSASELISGKEAAKDRIRAAILGLLLALGSYTILYTINPDLLITDLGLEGVTLGVDVQHFKIETISNPVLSGTNTPVVITAEGVCDTTAKASQATGVPQAFLLAIFGQETSSGAGGESSTGSCRIGQYPTCVRGVNGKVNSPCIYGTLQQMQNILNEITKPPPSWTRAQDARVSCPTSSGGNGGAIGYSQFLIDTWNTTKRNGGQTAVGHIPNPWNKDDALIMSSVLIKNNGYTNVKDSACKYFSGNTCDNRPSTSKYNYANCVQKRNDLYEEMLKKGECYIIKVKC